MPEPDTSRTAVPSTIGSGSISPTSAAASIPVAPDEIAMATARSSASTRSEGSATVDAAYVRPSWSRTAAPCSAPVRARDARARVTSLASSAGSSMLRTYRLATRDRTQATHEHLADPVAPPRRSLGLEPQTADLDDAAADRDLAQMLRHESADRVDILVLDRDVEKILQIVDLKAR